MEDGQFDGPLVEEAVRHALEPILREDIDVIVLGCTHFPALRPVIERVATRQVQVIDSGSAIARRTHYVLDTENLIQPDTTAGTLRVWCSGDPEKFSTIASELLGYKVTTRRTNI